LEELTLFDKTFKNVKNFKSATFPEFGNSYNPCVIIFSSDSELTEVENLFKAHSMPMQENLIAYGDLTKNEVNQISKNMVLPDDDVHQEVQGIIETKENFRNEMYAITGGFLFTGFLLGLSFLLGAALIIYYKQLTEGIEDKKSYKILQEVGMSKEAVKKAINSQTLLVFFMPLGVAIVHFIFALTMLKQMLLLFGVTGSSMIIVSGITILGLIIIYFLIYKFTSRTYYKAIER
ncbi:MAG: ABC transporter permease, partial [Streptococcus sp.]|uniref:FtsX-like permease family protein n=1 Tax=Streptococcus sp. TaxID=1306 RepID=UPI00338DECB6|nr:ABC transporter permease [Streptococcus sp.]